MDRIRRIEGDRTLGKGSVGAVFIPVKQVLGDSIIEEINRE